MNCNPSAYASFGRWLEELLAGAAPVDRATLAAAFEPSYKPAAPAGAYSLIMHATWEGTASVFSALPVTIVEPE
jgi:hypothetical protein